MKRAGISWMKFLPLCLLVQGCLSVGSSAPSISVEEVKLLGSDVGRVLRRDGVELDDISAVPLPIRLSNSDFSGSEGLNYHHVTNKMILDGLKSKLGTNFLKLQQKHEECKSQKLPYSQYPELGLEYKLRPIVEGASSDEFISFKLSEAFDGVAVIVEVHGKVVTDAWSGIPKIDGVMDLFESPDTLVLYRFGTSGFYGFNNVPGGKVFSLSIKDDRFKLAYLSSSLPFLADVGEILSVRIDTRLASVLGGPQTMNATLFIYPDSVGKVKKVYVMDKNFIFRDFSSRCLAMEGSKFLPEGMSCSK